jgi:hypothetical protein
MNEVGLETIGEERVDFIVLDEAEGVSVWCYLSKSPVVHIYEVLHEKVTKILEENFFLFSFPVPNWRSLSLHFYLEHVNGTKESTR